MDLANPSPPAAPELNPPASSAPARPPRALGFMLGAAAILGGLGVLVSLLSIPLTLRQSPEAMMKQARALAKAARAEAPLPATLEEGFEKARDEMAGEVVALQKRLRPFSLVYAAANLALSAGLLAGALLVRARREKGRRLLGAVAWLHLPLHALAIALRVATAMGMTAASTRMSSALMMRPMDASAAEVGSAVGKGFQRLSAVLGVGWTLVLAGFYVWLALTLRRQDVRRLCS